MATLTDTTIWAADKNLATVTVTLHSAATAGMTLILVVCGPAVVTANLQTSGGTLFSKRQTSTGTEEVSVQDVTCAGGETQVVLTLNGANNLSGIIYHFASIGAYISGCNNTGGNAAANATNHVAVLTSSAAVTGNAVLVSGFVSTATGGSYFNYGPAGHLYVNGNHATGTGGKFTYASGLSDITAAGSYPASLAAGHYKAYSQLPYTTASVFAAAAAYADTSGVATNAAAANNCAAENALPGTYQTNWWVTGFDGTIAGYCDKLSYAPGDTVNFKVDSGSNPFRVEIYRIGFYGVELNGARNVLGFEPAGDTGFITGTATAQSAPTVDSTLGSTSCAWTANATWAIPSGAQSGLYHVVFRRTDITTDFSCANFVVRPSSAKGKVAVVIADFTWHAYNVWGATADHGSLAAGSNTGRSLYQIGTDAGTANNAHRAYAVSFDRPCGTSQTVAQTWMMDSEQSTITFLEAQGYDLVYYSCADLENDTAATLLNQAAMVCLLGHHEYWTTNVYNSLTGAMGAGVPFMIQSGNTALWRTRFAAADTNKRTMICYKDSLSVDVTAGFDGGTGRDPVSYTGTWRDTRTATAPNNPDFRLEAALTGQHFVNGGNTAVKQQVPFASKGQPIWRNAASIQALTTGTTYTVGTGTAGWGAGFELDVPDGSTGSPPNLVSLNPFATGSLTAGANTNGSTYTATISPTASFSLYRRYGSRALVFNTGAWRGWWGLTRYALGTYANSSNVLNPDTNWQNAFVAIMYDLGQAPVTLSNAKPNVDTALTDPATGAPASPSDKTRVARAYGLTCPEDGLFMAAVV